VCVCVYRQDHLHATMEKIKLSKSMLSDLVRLSATTDEVSQSVGLSISRSVDHQSVSRSVSQSVSQSVSHSQLDFLELTNHISSTNKTVPSLWSQPFCL